MGTLDYQIWNVEELTGYKPLTTFYLEFSTIDHFGETAIRNKYSAIFGDAKQDYKELTELDMVLNWKMWEFRDNAEISKVYYELWDKTRAYATKKLKGAELKYFYKTTE